MGSVWSKSSVKLLAVAAAAVIVTVIAVNVGLIETQVAAIIASLIVALFTALYAALVFITIENHTKEWEASVRPLVTYDLIMEQKKVTFDEENKTLLFENKIELKNHSGYPAMNVFHFSYVVIERHRKNIEREEQGSGIDMIDVLDEKESKSISSINYFQLGDPGLDSSDKVYFNTTVIYRSTAEKWYKVHKVHYYTLYNFLENKNFDMTPTKMPLEFNEISAKDISKELRTSDGCYRPHYPHLEEFIESIGKSSKKLPRGRFPKLTRWWFKN